MSGLQDAAPVPALYESARALNEYLLFHYGAANETLPWVEGPASAVGYPQRCVRECLAHHALPASARALDLGCAVGGSSFELARHCADVTGVDYSRSFISAAEILQASGKLAYSRADEGDLGAALIASVPAEIDRSRVHFLCGDALKLPPGLGRFDVVLLANLIDRLRDPRACLLQLPELVAPGGQLIITSPYTWMEEFTPRSHWLGGFLRDGRPVSTLETLRAELGAAFDFIRAADLPFLIREHARKFQWSVAQATVWRRKCP